MKRNKFFGVTAADQLQKTSAFKKLKKRKDFEAMPPPPPKQKNASWMLKPLSREEVRRIESVQRPKEYYLDNVMFRFSREKQIPKHLDVDYDPVTKKYLR